MAGSDLPVTGAVTVNADGTFHVTTSLDTLGTGR